jgi:hypothetical protein
LEFTLCLAARVELLTEGRFKDRLRRLAREGDILAMNARATHIAL